MALFKKLSCTLLVIVLVKTSQCQVPCDGDGSKSVFGLPSPGFLGLNQRALGVGNGSIPDDRLSASSSWNGREDHGAQRGRLNSVADTDGIGAWCNSGPLEENPWIQVALDGVTMVTGVGTQGRSESPDVDRHQHVTSYEVGCSVDGDNFDKISRKSGECTSARFVGNFDQDTVVINQFNDPYLCRFVRIYPRTFNNFVCMRFEVYGF